MPDYLLSDILQGILFSFFVPWTVVMIWLVFVGYRYICKQHDTIDNLRDANDILKADLEQCYARLPMQEWVDVLSFGDSDPRREVMK